MANKAAEGENRYEIKPKRIPEYHGDSTFWKYVAAQTEEALGL